MPKIFISLLLMLFSTLSFPEKVPNQTPREYLAAAIEIIKNNALNADKIEWQKAEEEAFNSILMAKTTADTYPIIRKLLKQLEDGHSYFRNPVQYKKNKFSKVEDNEPVESRLLESAFGYLKIPGIKGYTDEENLRHAIVLQQHIAKLDSLELKGWIIDLRENTGGNMWPMMAGLGPLLGNGKLGSMNFPDEKHYWFYQDGKVGFDDENLIILPDSGYIIKNTNCKIIVLIGANTMSSGEAMAIAFKELRNVSLMGQPSKGLSTVNVSHKLSDGAQIVLTEGVFADRTGKEYGGKIIPDIVIPKYKDDRKIIEEAVKLLKSQPK